MDGEISFGRIVKERRRARDLTQAEMARRVACATITIRKIEADALRPSRQIAERLAIALAVPPAEQANFVQLARTASLIDRLPRPIPTPPLMPGEVGQQNLSGRAIRGYELGKRIAVGGFGAVYQAVQPLVEREVAVKIILPQYADHPEFIRRFEAEAQLVARLEHPYIVPLYDYWREPGVAYLVMRLMRGGSLQAKLKDGPFFLEATIRLLQQIGNALYCAHRAGVIHRDIKPANILLDEDDNAYLADFGFAKDLADPNLMEQTEAGAIIGSLEYISPEQIQAEPVRPQSDIYCLGIVLYEMLTGQKPFQGSTPVDYIHLHLSKPLPSLSAYYPDLAVDQDKLVALDAVIARATAKNPLERYPDVVALLTEIQEILSLPAVTTLGVRRSGGEDGRPSAVGASPVDLENPFKGLHPFSEPDVADFFGRDTLIQALLGRMTETADLARFLAVVGPSGSGKSSVIRAGLIPALRQGGLPGSEKWFIIEMLPGRHPLEELEAVLLRVAVNPPESLLAQLGEDGRGLLRAVRRILPADETTELVLIIDQFEEIFTLCTEEAVRAHLMDSLVTAVLDPRSRLRVIITLRADFTDRPLQYVDFGELVRQRTEFVLPLTPDEMEEAIIKPAERVGLTIEPGLPETIVQDLGAQPGTLPLLQYTLTELFERRVGSALTLGAYQASGRVRGALASRADELYADLDEVGQKAARQLFLRLITLGEVTSDGLSAPDTRRRVLRPELMSLDGSTTDDDAGREPSAAVDSQRSPVISQVIDQFGRYRLLTFDRDPVTRGATVEVAHEALIREWGRLRGWLEEDREYLLWQQHLRAALRQWEASEQDEGALLRGVPLAEAENWFTQRWVDLSEAERSFIQAGLDLRKRKAAEREAQRQRELEAAKKLAETEKARVTEQAQALQRLKRGALLLAGVLVIAVILAIAALIARQQAETQRRLAFSRELASAAVNNLNVDPERSILLALQALSTTHTLEAENSLHRAIPASRIELTLAGHAAEVWGVTYNPDGTQLATSSWDGTIKLWESTSGLELLTLSGHAGPVFGLDYSPDGTRLATASADGTVKVWDVELGETLFTLSDHGDLVFDVTFSPNGNYLVTGSVDQTAKIWAAETGKTLLTLSGYKGFINYVAFSPNGNLVAAGGDDGTVRIWDVATLLHRNLAASTDTSGWESVSLQVGGGAHNAPSFSPDGKRLVTGTESGLVKVWDVEASIASASGQELFTLSEHNGPVFHTVFSPDGTLLASGSADGTAIIWDANSGQQRFQLSGHTGIVPYVAFSPDGKHLATANWDGTTKVWDLSPSRELLTLAAHRNEIHSLIFNPAGEQLVTSDEDGTAKIWDLDMSLSNASGQALRTFSGHTDSILDAAFSPDGMRLVTAGEDWVAKIWDTSSGRELLTLTGHNSGPYKPRYEGVTGVAFSPDGKHLATVGNDGKARIWDAATGQEVLTMPGHAAEYSAGSPFLGAIDIAFSPDGKHLATVGSDDKAIVWDISTAPETGSESDKVLFILSGHQADIVHITFNSDGTRLATASFDTTAKVWDAKSGGLLLTLSGHTGIVDAVTFSPNGAYLATASEDGTAKVWDAETGEALLTLTGHTGFVETVTFSPDGTRLLTAGQDGTVRVYVLPLEDLTALARSRVTRSLTQEECQQFLHLDECPASP